MTGSLNKVMLIGNVGREPELRYTANGVAQAKFSLAVNHSKKAPEEVARDTGKKYITSTEWFNVVAWQALAEQLPNFVDKGMTLYVEGRLQTRSWEDDQGLKHYMTEVVATSVQALERREQRDGGGYGRSEGGSEAEYEPDDLPFE